MSRVWVGAHDCGSWSPDGTHTLGVDTGCGVDPPEVYIPTESAWPQAVPEWARGLRAELVRDFEARGFRVVARPHVRLTGP